MSIVTSFTPEANFWELHPLLTVAGEFKTLYEEDKSKGKIESSKLMWFVAFCYEIEDNPFFNLPLNEKHGLIGKDWMEDDKFYEKNKLTLDPLIAFYCELQDTASIRHYREWTILLDKRSNFIKTQSYDLSTFEELDKMAVGTEKLYNVFKKIKDEMTKEGKSGGTVLGGKVASLSDTGEI